VCERLLSFCLSCPAYSLTSASSLLSSSSWENLEARLSPLSGRQASSLISHHPPPGRRLSSLCPCSLPPLLPPLSSCLLHSSYTLLFLYYLCPLFSASPLLLCSLSGGRISHACTPPALCYMPTMAIYSISYRGDFVHKTNMIWHHVMLYRIIIQQFVWYGRPRDDMASS